MIPSGHRSEVFYLERDWIFDNTSVAPRSFNEAHSSTPFSETGIIPNISSYSILVYLPYLAHTLGWTPEHSLIKIGNLGLAFFNET